MYVAGDPVQYVDPWGLCFEGHGTWRDRLAVALAAARGAQQGLFGVVQGLYPYTVGNILDLAHGAGAELGFIDENAYEPQGAIAAWVGQAYDPSVQWYYKTPLASPLGRVWGRDMWAAGHEGGVVNSLRLIRDTAGVAGMALGGVGIARAAGLPGTYQETVPAAAQTSEATKSGTNPGGTADDTVNLYHQGNLRNGQVSCTRSLSTSRSSDLTHYHPEGQLYEFQIPRNTYQQWMDDGLIMPAKDMHAPTGIFTEEIRVLPPASGELNQFLIKSGGG